MSRYNTRPCMGYQSPLNNSSLLYPPPSLKNTLGLVLAGGESRRMPGTDKALLSVQGETLAYRACRRLLLQVRQILISSNNVVFQAAGSLPDNVALVSDDALSKGELQKKGPLSGVLSALLTPHFSAAEAVDSGMKQQRYEWLLLAPVDAPGFPSNLFALLTTGADKAVTSYGSAESDSGCVRVMHDGSRLQPLFALIHKSVAIGLQRYLLTGGRSVHGWLEEQPHWQIDGSQYAENFRNINDPDQWQDWLASEAPGT